MPYHHVSLISREFLMIQSIVQPDNGTLAAGTQVKRMLIAEDNYDLRRIFAKVFSNKHFDVHVVVDGREAISTLEQIMPDILLLDVNMPHVSGLEVLAHVRQ